MPKRNFRCKFDSITLGIVLGLAVAPGLAAAQTQEPPTGAPAQTPPTGVTTLPDTPPPTGLQAPLPKPANPLPRPDKPMLSSPTLQQLGTRIPKTPITIEQAVAVALGNNSDLSLAAEALLRARGRTSETRAALNPNVSTSFNYTRLDAGQTAVIGNQSIAIVNADQPQLAAQTTLPIDIAGELRAAVNQAQFQEVAARIDVNRVRNLVVSNVKTAFYNVLRAQALVVVAQETLQDNLDRLSDAQKKFNAGTSAQFDVIRAQTDLNNAQQQLITAQSNVALTIANLNNTLGISIDAPLKISDKGAVENPPGIAPPAPSPDPANPVPTPQPTKPAPAETKSAGGQGGNTNQAADTLNLGPEYANLVLEAIKNRPEVLEADANIAAARKGIVIARRSIYPTLGLSLGVNYAPNTAGFAPKYTTGTFVFALTAPIYDGGVAKARVTQARADLATAETNRRQSVDAVNLDVRNAYLTLLQARDRVAVANQALAEAQESYRLARVRYNNGVSTLVEVSDAQAALTTAENNQVNALYDYNNDRSNLDKAAGRYSYLANGPGYAAPPTAKVTGAISNPQGDGR